MAASRCLRRKTRVMTCSVVPARPLKTVGRLDSLAFFSGHDLVDIPRGHNRIPLDVEDRQKQLVGFVEGHALRRDDRDLARHRLVVEKILAGQFADGLDQVRQLDIVEVESDPAFRRGWRLSLGKRLNRNQA